MPTPFDVDPADHRGYDTGSLSVLWYLIERRADDDLWDPVPLPRPEPLDLDR